MLAYALDQESCRLIIEPCHRCVQLIPLTKAGSLLEMEESKHASDVTYIAYDMRTPNSDRSSHRPPFPIISVQSDMHPFAINICTKKNQDASFEVKHTKYKHNHCS